LNDGSVIYYIDDIIMYIDVPARRVFREDFSYGDWSELTTVWTESDPVVGTYMELTTARNIGLSRSVLGIDPISVSDYTSIDAQLELLNGWYSAAYYNNNTQAGEEFFFSGYKKQWLGWLSDRYYQHYITVLDIPETGIYDIKIEHPDTGTHNNRLILVDGREITLNSTNEAALYLRTGLHPLYLRMYADGSQDTVNAFRAQVTPRDDACVVRAYVPHHGRMQAIYYDARHADRIRETKSPSFFETPETVLDNAALMMASGIIGGPKVLVDADDLLDYMMRDINTGIFYNGHSYSPLFETAGSVIMTSDLVPDTIFYGEDEGSIVERFLEFNGYYTTDGNIPFYIVSHEDGSMSTFDLGPQRVLDLPHNETHDVWYHPDGYTTTFGPFDGPDDDTMTQNLMDEKRLWIENGFTYTLQMPTSAAMDEFRVYNIRATLTSFDGHPIENSENTMVGYGLTFEEWSGHVDPLGSTFKWKKIGYEDNILNKMVLPPGPMKVTMTLELEEEYMYFSGGFPAYGDWSDTPHDVKLSLSQIFADGNWIYNSDRRVSNITENTHGREFNADDVVVSNILPNQQFDVTFTIWNTQNDLYKMFTDFFTCVVHAKVNDYVDSESVWGHTKLKVKEMQIHKEFLVATDMGIDDEYAMTLPMHDTGQLTNMYIERVAIERNRGTIQSLMNDGNFYDHAIFNISNYQIPTVLSTVVDTGNVNQPTFLSSSSGLPYTEVSRIPLLNLDGDIDYKNYKLNFKVTGIDRRLGASYMSTPYHWQILDEDNRYIQSTLPNEMYKYWMPKYAAEVKRVDMTYQVTETGKLLPADLGEYTPQWSINTQQLTDHGRRYLDYGLHNTTGADYASPISFEADDDGGGILTFGLAQKISREHLIRNTTMTLLYMDFIARSNHMNMWGYALVEDAVVVAELDYTVEDRLELMNQEGWIDELIGWVYRQAQAEDDLASQLDTLIEENPWLQLSPQFLLITNAIRLGDSFLENIPEQTVPDRLGNGVMDVFVEKTSPDYNGADWYKDPYETVNGKQNVLTHKMNESMILRPTLYEQSDWDDDSPEFDLWLPIMNLFNAPGSIRRHQLIRGREFRLDIDWAAIEDVIGTSQDIYVTASLEGGGLADGVRLWKNSTLSNALNQNFAWDIHNVTRSKDGTPIWMSENENDAYTTPIVRVFIYQKRPEMATDMIDMVTNTLFADVYYVRATMDEEYVHEYIKIQRQLEQDAEDAKAGMILLGGAMVVAGIITLNPATVFWGADLIISTRTGKSILDHISHAALRAAGVDEKYIESFSFMHFTSDKSMDMFLQEAFANGISALGGKVSSRLSSWLGKNVVTDITVGIGRRVLNRAGGWVANRIRSVFPRVASFLTRIGVRIVDSFIKALFVFVLDALLEATFELSFEAMGRLNKGERPGGGNTGMFFAVMAATTLVGAVFSRISSRFAYQVEIDRQTRTNQIDIWDDIIVEMRWIGRWEIYTTMFGLSLQLLTWTVASSSLIAMAG
jgi:hypothetical protein